jgi:glycosyltransferase involved in cell wall biosynthesis
LASKNPKLGIVVPTLNSAATLEGTLCALCGQRDVAPEIIVADSGSVDGTLEICKSWGVHTFYVPPGNMYRAINLGLRRMETEWIAYMNSDDWVYPQSYARMLAFGEQQGAAAVYGDVDFVDYEGRFLFVLKTSPPSRLPGLFRRGIFGFQPAAAIFRSRVFRELEGFDEQFRLIGDYDFYYRLAVSGHRLAKLSGPAVAAFRVYASQMSAREGANMLKERDLFWKARNVKGSPRDLLDVLYWRLQNSPIYLWRLMRQRPSADACSEGNTGTSSTEADRAANVGGTLHT